MNSGELTVVVQGDIYSSLSEEEKNLVGRDYIVLRPTLDLDGSVDGLIALNVVENNLPDDYMIRVDLYKLPENLKIKLQGAIVTYPKNEKGFYEDIYGLYEKTNGMKK